MYLIKNTNTNPYFNLALEQYLLESFNHDCITLWRNSKTVVVGRNQNTSAEINRDYTNIHKIAVVRRLTGGGAVFHDSGNVNYTVISSDTSQFNNYSFFTDDLIGFLSSLGISANLSGRNDIECDGVKISGNAQCIHKNRLMHHGCILFDSDLKTLIGCLNVKREKFEDKAVKSISSRVVNISSLMQKKISTNQFVAMFEEYLLKKRLGWGVYKLTENDIENVNALVIEKYNTYEWNYGNSPQYNYSNKIKCRAGIIEVYINAEQGVINKIKISGDFFGKRSISELEDLIMGILHDKYRINNALSDIDITEYITGISKDELVAVLV